MNETNQLLKFSIEEIQKEKMELQLRIADFVNEQVTNFTEFTGVSVDDVMVHIVDDSTIRNPTSYCVVGASVSLVI